MGIWFAREWRIPKLFIVLMIIEFPLTVACLTLMGIAQPDTYRTKLWQNGFDAGFNSAPNSILYAYANWQTPTVPIPWASDTTEYNVVASVLSMFVLLAKSAMYVMHIFLPAISVVVHAMLVAVYCVSIYKQSAPDMSDKKHPSPGMPWYLSKGCQYATQGNKGYCMQAQASFAVVIVMTALFVVYLAYSIWNLRLTPEERAKREEERESDLEMKRLSIYGNDTDLSKEDRETTRKVFLNLPKTPNTPGFGGRLNPMTPRTVAFTQLNGGLPPTKQAAVSTGKLPFRSLDGR